jgi:membrane associated rhomboid family serine protease
MLILGDEGHYHGRFPWVTTSLIVANVLVFTAQVFLGEEFTHGFSVVPEEIVTCHDIIGTKYHKVKIPVNGYYDSKGHFQYVYETKHFPVKHYHGPFPIFLTLLTCMFMHGDIVHLIGNMWFLAVFGRNVECAMSHGRFLAFYIACGIAASIAHVLSDIHSILPCLGASGAISGVMGAYVSIHPLNKIKIWFGWWLGVIEVPAIIVIGLWFLLQYLSAFWALEDGISDGVAYWAHLGGFCAGFAILRGVIIYLRRQQAAGLQAEDEPLAPVDKDVLLPATGTAIVPNPLEKTTAESEANDPFATFLSVQTIRKIQKEKAALEQNEN